MAYKVEFTPKSAKQFSKLDKAIQQRIQAFIRRLQALEEPKSIGKPLIGNLAGMWRYRVGDYRLLSKIEADRLIILLVSIEHRSSAYD